jgi:galactose mutarotase-like enzyme
MEALPDSSVDLRSPDGRLEATFVPGVGMLGCSLRHDGEELLGQRASVPEYASRGRATGIPLLHPWANRLASLEYEIAGRRVVLDPSAPNVRTDPNGLPIHGLVAGSPRWEVVEAEPGTLRARLDFAAWPELRNGFPFPHVLELSLHLSDTRLEVITELVPSGDVPVPVAFGFHPLLRLPGLGREDWILELPVTSRMPLDERMLPTGASEPVDIPPAPLGDRSFDEAFDGLADPPEFALSGGGLRVALRLLEGYPFAQVWTPPGGDFVAFEPMTAPANPFESRRTHLAEPGSRYRARFEISSGQDL